MRQSKYLFIDACHDIKIFLKVGSYEMHDYDDGCYADFKVKSIKDPNSLNGIIAPLEYYILSEGDMVVIRVFEDFKEY